jgi:phage N-6-adenine-methyltransferase
VNTALHFSSATPEWSTPQDLFDELDAEFGFTLDVSATVENAKCPVFYSQAEDGLRQPWRGVCWCNPPYGRGIGRWVAKAHEAALAGATVVCLVPARPDTGWWHEHCRFAEIRFLRGRLRFGGGENAAPFPSAVVIFGRGAGRVLHVASRHGSVTATCRGCGCRLTGRLDARYCSAACKQRAYRERGRP